MDCHARKARINGTRLVWQISALSIFALRQTKPKFISLFFRYKPFGEFVFFPILYV